MLKAQRAAAYSRNLALEKVFELQKLQANDNSLGSHANGCPAADQAPANSSIASEPATHPRSNPIHLSVDVDTLTRFRGRQPAPMTRFSKSQIENFEFADFAKLWKEYISRYNSHLHKYVCGKRQACLVAVQVSCTSACNNAGLLGVTNSGHLTGPGKCCTTQPVHSCISIRHPGMVPVCTSSDLSLSVQAIVIAA